MSPIVAENNEYTWPQQNIDNEISVINIILFSIIFVVIKNRKKSIQGYVL